MIMSVEKRMINKTKKQLPLLIMFLLLSFLFLTNSPLHPWKNAEPGRDSSVFETVAMMMMDGSIPYKDTFDHKGPLIYIFNLLGNKIAGYAGVWYIEFISLVVTFLFLYKIASLFNINQSKKIICILLGFSLLFDYFEGGNLVEEYALPFISIGLYIFLDFFKNRKINRIRLVSCGLCFGCVCMLRINMIAVWIVFPIAVIFSCIKKKNYNRIGTFALWFLIGFTVSVGPFMIWLGSNNALVDFWNSYINFNLSYSSIEGGMAPLSTKWNVFFSFSNTVICSITIVSTIYLLKKDRLFYGFYLGYIILNLFFIAMSGMLYKHYGMILLPTVIVPVASFLSDLNNEGKIGSILSSIISGFFVCFLVFSNWMMLLQECAILFEQKSDCHISNESRMISGIVSSLTNENEKISVYGNYNAIYVLSKRQHATMYSYQYPIGNINPQILDNYWKQLKKEEPNIIVVQKGKYDNRISTFLDENEYQLLWSDENSNESSMIYYQREELFSKGEKVNLQTVKLSHASVIKDQKNGDYGISCSGCLNREYNDDLACSEFIREHDYIGFELNLNDISTYHGLSFWGKKITSHGQPSVYIYDNYGNCILSLSDYYGNLDNNWKFYYIDLLSLKGEATIVFNGGYTDLSGNPDSEYVFSQIFLY